MNNILYIGNKLSGQNTNITYIDILGKHLESQGYKVIYASSKQNQAIRLFDMIFKTLKNQHKINKVLIDTYSTNGFIFALIISQLCRLLNLKYIPILHGGNLPYRLQKNPKLCKLIFDNSQINVAPSFYLYKAFTEAGFQKIIPIPNCISIENYTFKNSETKTPKLLWVRSFSDIYNPKMAIFVYNEVLKIHPTAELCMVGPNQNDLFFECKKLADELKIKVQFTGKLTKQEWISLARDFNIFINTTHQDNTPLSVIEAMALGLAIVSTNVGGIPNLITNQENGLLVNDNDVMAMSQEIINLTNNQDLFATITSNARKSVEKFDWKIVKKQWFDILQ